LQKTIAENNCRKQLQKTIAEKSQKSYAEVNKFRPTDKTKELKTKEVVIVYPK
jgi:hypothetical protein